MNGRHLIVLEFDAEAYNAEELFRFLGDLLRSLPSISYRASHMTPAVDASSVKWNDDYLTP
jgi:hypothetical protein